MDDSTLLYNIIQTAVKRGYNGALADKSIYYIREVLDNNMHINFLTLNPLFARAFWGTDEWHVKTIELTKLDEVEYLHFFKKHII